METSQLFVDEEFETEDVMSYNHAKLTYRLAKQLAQYDERYDILPELEFSLATGRAKPDVAICQPNRPDWLRDVIRPTAAPLIAIEILSPRQALSDLTDKALDIYFPSGTPTVWVVVPHFRQITVMTPTGQQTFTNGVVTDPSTGIELDIGVLFDR